jgi:hypothetical protein
VIGKPEIHFIFFWNFTFWRNFAKKEAAWDTYGMEKAMASWFHGVQFGRKTFFCTWLKLETKRGLIAKTMYLT